MNALSAPELFVASRLQPSRSFTSRPKALQLLFQRRRTLSLAPLNQPLAISFPRGTRRQRRYAVRCRSVSSSGTPALPMLYPFKGVTL